jgi:predicted alpha/beta-fold hydrolase
MGEYGDQIPEQLRGVAAISPSVSLGASCDLLMSPRNWIYHKEFLHNLKRRIKVKEKLFPDQYDSSGLRKIRSLREFDDAYIAPAFGFADADDYYRRASSLPHIAQIRVPALIIHAQDDPFVPFEPLREPAVTGNPHVLLLSPERGGHVAFLAAESPHEDRFWAENRVIDFFRLASER